MKTMKLCYDDDWTDDYQTVDYKYLPSSDIWWT